MKSKLKKSRLWGPRWQCAQQNVLSKFYRNITIAEKSVTKKNFCLFFLFPENDVQSFFSLFLLYKLFYYTLVKNNFVVLGRVKLCCKKYIVMFGIAKQLLQIIEYTMFGAILLAAGLQSTCTAEVSFTQYRHTQTHTKQSLGLGSILLKKISQENIAEIYKQWKKQ